MELWQAKNRGEGNLKEDEATELDISQGTQPLLLLDKKALSSKKVDDLPHDHTEIKYPSECHFPHFLRNRGGGGVGKGDPLGSVLAYLAKKTISALQISLEKITL
jgi:hypothetical protein